MNIKMNIKIMKTMIWVTLILACSIGCSSTNDHKNYTVVTEKGVKVYKNESRPANPNLTLQPREIFRIEEKDEGYKGTERELLWPRFLDVDQAGNIFIVDAASASVKKFDKNGHFLKSFGKEGVGPAEMRRPFMVVLSQNILHVADAGGKRLVRFDTEGNLVDNIILLSGMPNFLQAVGKDRFIGFMSIGYQTEKGVFRGFNLDIMDAKFNKITVLNQYAKPYDPKNNDYLDRFTAYAVGKESIYVAENSDSHYKINVFDFNGRLLYAIEKEYQKVAFIKEELAELNDSLHATTKKFGNPIYFPIKATYKKAINAIYYDDQAGRLLVASAVPRDKTNRYDFFLDVFKDGVFLKKVTFNIAPGCDYTNLHAGKVFFKFGRVYHIDENNALIRVFEY